MTISYLYFSLSALFNAVISTLLGIFIYSRNRKSKVNISFSLFCLSVALWSYAYIFWPLAKTAQGTLLSFQLLHIGACFTSIFYLYFVVTWLDIEKQNRKILYFGYCIATLFASLVFSPLFIKDMVPIFNMRFWAVPGILYPFYLAMFFGFIIYSSYLLIVNYRVSTGTKRTQIAYILVGMVISFVGGSTNYFLWYNINIPPYGNIFASSFVILSAYAIIKHRLMDIKFVLRKYSVFLASLSSIVIVAVAIKYFIERFYEDFSLWADFFILLGALFVYPSIKDYFYKVANKYFFSSLYDSSEVIAGLSEKLRSTLDIRKIYQFIAETLINAFHVKGVGILSYNKSKDNFTILYNNGFNTYGQNFFPNDPELNKSYAARGETLIVDEVKRLGNKKYKKTLDLLDSLKVEVLTPLNIKDKTIGLLALGAKESADIFNDEDLKILKVVGAQAAIAIENALLYEETRNFSIKLEKEVEKATRDLRQANEQLKKLDAAKSDFISIASHQLRTPLTVIKGYISMMLEGSFGKLTTNEKESLIKVFESNERLINLVENLLNISRIESGRLLFDFKPVQLEKMVASVIDELSAYAKRKNLYLDFKKLSESLPKVKIDQEKIRQVIMNLVDNAIKYTKRGGVTIELKEADKNIRCCISDTGLGITKEDLPNLFKKFSRGQGTILVHTEGIGLGLYVADMMIRAHHGKIWAESMGKGLGSKFYFEIPVK